MSPTRTWSTALPKRGTGEAYLTQGNCCLVAASLLLFRIYFVSFVLIHVGSLSPQLDEGASGPVGEIIWEEEVGCCSASALLPHLSTAIWRECLLFLLLSSYTCLFSTPPPLSHAEYRWLFLPRRRGVVVLNPPYPWVLIVCSCQCVSFGCVFMLTLLVVG